MCARLPKNEDDDRFFRQLGGRPKPTRSRSVINAPCSADNDEYLDPCTHAANLRRTYMYVFIVNYAGYMGVGRATHLIR
jgi:hypothetical protein